MLAVAFVDPCGQKYPSLQFPLHDDLVSFSPPHLPAEQKPLQESVVCGADAPNVPAGHGYFVSLVLPEGQ